MWLGLKVLVETVVEFRIIKISTILRTTEKYRD